MNILTNALNPGFAGISLFILVITIISVLIIWFMVRLSRKFHSVPTYDEYIKNNTDSKTGNGIICRKCGSSHISAKRVGHTPGSALFLHICENCGTTLFRSKG